MKGGKRPGAGRPPGARNKKTLATAEAIEASGMAPLEYMVTVMRDRTVEPAMRLDAAKGAAPYVHARLSSSELPDDKAPERPVADIMADIQVFIAQNPDFLQSLIPPGMRLVAVAQQTTVSEGGAAPTITH